MDKTHDDDLPKQVVIIPTKNRRALLERALESINLQAYPRLRVIVVDDGSSDGTQEFLATYADTRPYITVLRHDESRGVNVARNDALALVGADDIVSFLDDDDYLLPGALAEIAKTFAHAPDSISCIRFNTDCFTSAGIQHNLGFEFNPGESFHDAPYAELMAKKRQNGATYMATRGTLWANGRYRYAEDMNGFESELLWRMVRDGVGIRFVNTVAMMNDLRGDNHLSVVGVKRDRLSFVRARRRVFRDHQPFFETHPSFGLRHVVQGMHIALRVGDFQSFFYFLSRGCRLIGVVLIPGLRLKERT